MATYQGVGISFGIGTVTGGPVTGKLQTLEWTKNADTENVRDDNGTTVARVFFDPNQDATFEYVVTGANSTTADTNCTLVDPGAMVTITATGGAAAINGQIFSVESQPKLNRSNAGVARVTIPLKRYASITATVS